MKASHTLEQRQAVGIEEDLLAGPTSGSRSKLNGKILTLVFNNLPEYFINIVIYLKTT